MKKSSKNFLKLFSVCAYFCFFQLVIASASVEVLQRSDPPAPPPPPMMAEGVRRVGPPPPPPAPMLPMQASTDRAPSLPMQGRPVLKKVDPAQALKKQIAALEETIVALTSTKGKELNSLERTEERKKLIESIQLREQLKSKLEFFEPRPAIEKEGLDSYPIDERFSKIMKMDAEKRLEIDRKSKEAVFQYENEKLCAQISNLSQRKECARDLKVKLGLFSKFDPKDQEIQSLQREIGDERKKLQKMIDKREYEQSSVAAAQDYEKLNMEIKILEDRIEEKQKIMFELLNSLD